METQLTIIILQALNKFLKSSQDENCDLRNQISNLENSKQDLQLYYENKIKNNIENYENQISLLNKQLVESVIEDNIRTLMHQQILHRNQSLLNEREDKISSMLFDLSTSHISISNLHQEIDKYKLEIESLHHTIESMQQNIDTITIARDNLILQTEQLNSELDNMRVSSAASLSDYQIAFRELRTQLDATRDINVTQLSTIESLTTQVTQLEENLMRTQSDLEETSVQLGISQDRLASKDILLSDQIEVNERLQAALAVANEQLAVTQSACEALTYSNKELQGTVSHLQSEHEARAKETEVEVGGAMEKLQAIAQSLSLSREELEAREAQLAATQASAAAELEAARDKYEKSLEEQRHVWNEMLLSKEKYLQERTEIQRMEYEAQIDDLKLEVSKRQQEYRAVMRMMDEREEIRVDLNNRISSLESELQEKTRLIDRLRSDIYVSVCRSDIS